MRDRRFVAVHRGGPLTLEHHRKLAAWAADCAEHVLPFFEAISDDDRPRQAIVTARAWANAGARVGDAQEAAVRSHAAAREAPGESAVSVARAAGHAAATAHMADHCLGAATYAIKAVDSAGESKETERTWQIQQLPDDLRDLVVSALNSERFASHM